MTWVAAEWLGWQEALAHITSVCRSPTLCHAELRAHLDAGEIRVVDRCVGVGIKKQLATTALNSEFLRVATARWSTAWIADDVLAAARRARGERDPPGYGSDPWMKGFDPAVFEQSGQHHVFLARADVLKWWPAATATPNNRTEAANPSRRRPGPVTTHDWHAICGEIARRCINPKSKCVQVPKSESGLARKMLDWCQHTYDREPAESEMREAVRQICAALRQA